MASSREGSKEDCINWKNCVWSTSQIYILYGTELLVTNRCNTRTPCERQHKIYTLSYRSWLVGHVPGRGSALYAVLIAVLKKKSKRRLSASAEQQIRWLIATKFTSMSNSSMSRHMLNLIGIAQKIVSPLQRWIRRPLIFLANSTNTRTARRTYYIPRDVVWTRIGCTLGTEPS